MQKTILLLGLLIAPTAVMAQSEVCSSSYTIATVSIITSTVAVVQCK